ncbi:hypothetical protein AC1031_009679 [Aphanomyces cochlioides]|nr:hypothetical protein AC1031_009679 [Aphanomyces cochlioides]
MQARLTYTKVHSTRQNEPSVRLSRWSVVYNVAFVVNLATTPFMAYLTEPLLGKIAQVHLPEWNSFQEYTDIVSTYLHALYNNTTMPYEVCKQDRTTNTIPDSQVQGYITHMAGSSFFGEGVDAYMTTFFTSNASSRAVMKPWRICQHHCLVGINFGEFCFWLDAVVDGVQDSNSPRYAVWVAVYPLETPQLSWFKLIFRSVVSTYVLYVFWTRYYRQYGPLLHNLRTVGLGSEYMHYQAVLGDPGYAILIDPFVSFAIFVDIWCGAPYIAIATILVSQFQDLLSYAVGCMYLSRTVWFAYLCMRGLSAVVKWRQWEAWFAPVDPGF